MKGPVDRETHSPTPLEASEAFETRRRSRPFGLRGSFVTSIGVHGTLIAGALLLGLGPVPAPGRVFFSTAMAFERLESSIETWVADVEPLREPLVELPPEPDLLPVVPTEPDPAPAPEAEPELAEPEDLAQIWASVSLEPIPRRNPPEIEQVSSAAETPADSPEPVELADATPEPVLAELRVTGPLMLSNPSPLYPKVAHRLGQEGVVVLTIRVSAAGRVIDVHVKDGSGYRLLDRAAVDAVSEWRFYPATENGIRVAWTFDHAVRFLIDA